MKILYVSQYFPPEMGAPSARVHELSREWVRMGHQVVVVTGFAHHPTGVKAKEDHRVITRRQTIDGIDVIRAYVYATANKGNAKRMLSYASFMTSAAIIGAVRASRPDVVVATSPQLLCAVGGYALAKRFGVPFVFEVRDLWPESIMAVGAMKENMVIRGLRKTAHFLYRRSHTIVTVGTGYKKGIVERYGIDEKKIRVIPNGIDTARFIPGPRRNAIREKYGWGDKFVVMYVGTHGMAHGLHTALAAAEQLRDDPRLMLVFVGEGAEKANLKTIAAEKKLTNVQFIDQQSKDMIPLFYSACDVGLVVLRDTPLFQEVLPSKIFEYLGMERAIILGVAGEARALVEAAGAGRHVSPDSPEELVEQFKWCMAHAGELEPMGKSGRTYVLEHYDRQALAKKYVEILKNVSGKE